MPRELVEAVDDHGEIRGDTLLEDVDEASRILDAFEAAGVDYDDVVADARDARAWRSSPSPSPT